MDCKAVLSVSYITIIAEFNHMRYLKRFWFKVFLKFYSLTPFLHFNSNIYIALFNLVLGHYTDVKNRFGVKSLKVILR